MQIEIELTLVKETENKLRWDGTSEDILLELYVPKWRVPLPVPIHATIIIRVAMLAEREPHGYSREQVLAESSLCQTPILTRLSYLREHTETWRYDPEGPNDEWQLGSLYVPKHLVGVPAPEHIDIAVFWEG